MRGGGGQSFLLLFASHLIWICLDKILKTSQDQGGGLSENMYSISVYSKLKSNHFVMPELTKSAKTA